MTLVLFWHVFHTKKFENFDRAFLFILKKSLDCSWLPQKYIQGTRIGLLQWYYRRFCLPTILPPGHFDILPPGHFASRPFWHFASRPFCLPAILPPGHFASRSFCLPAIFGSRPFLAPTSIGSSNGSSIDRICDLILLYSDYKG